MAENKNQLREALTKAFDEFIEELSSFDDSLINKKPFAGSWTPAQVALHIIKATDGVPDNKTKESDREIDFYLPMIRPWWEDLNQKFKSPEALLPDEKIHSKQELLSELQRIKEKDIDIVLHKDLTLACMDVELPIIGFLTRYEWLWFIQMHLNRHIFQLRNMKK